MNSTVVPFSRDVQPAPLPTVVEVEVETCVVTLQAAQLQRQLEHLSTLVVQDKLTLNDLADLHHNMVAHVTTCEALMNAVN